ncbi:MAG: response regulator transcription factor [Anaerolineales bacterium]|nr:response regulator transcription factor [Anaerolineales bacterium]
MEIYTFLLANDNPACRQHLRRLVEAQPGWVVVAEAGDGAEAVRLAADCAPDVVLIDAMMPGMDGIEATWHIKTAAPQTRVIVLSGYPDEEFRRASLRAGADHYLREEDLNAESLTQRIATLFPQDH